MIRPSFANQWLREVSPELAAFLQRYFGSDKIEVRPPADAVLMVEGTTTVVLYREGCFQVELVALAPNLPIPEHVHPDVESYEVALAGELEFFVDGLQAGFIRASRADGRSRDLGKYVPVRADAPHGGRTGARGAAFLSVQRWREGTAPGHVLLNWAGPPMGEQHADHVKK